eukprot:TRINITY_DN103499_c0_g1_i1.p1 TRINITY_DN103499_c0_g1~~TRINITY_DN103499_c0_g1_i1.p1  ORF type:complete len:996 (+),score=272.98 TRINITY_DN103499_c0_g1_i1:71-3058(+)
MGCNSSLAVLGGGGDASFLNGPQTLTITSSAASQVVDDSSGLVYKTSCDVCRGLVLSASDIPSARCLYIHKTASRIHRIVRSDEPAGSSSSSSKPAKAKAAKTLKAQKEAKAAAAAAAAAQKPIQKALQELRYREEPDVVVTSSMHRSRDDFYRDLPVYWAKAEGAKDFAEVGESEMGDLVAFCGKTLVLVSPPQGGAETAPSGTLLQLVCFGFIGCIDETLCVLRGLRSERITDSKFIYTKPVWTDCFVEDPGGARMEIAVERLGVDDLAVNCNLFSARRSPDGYSLVQTKAVKDTVKSMCLAFACSGMEEGCLSWLLRRAITVAKEEAEEDTRKIQQAAAAAAANTSEVKGDRLEEEEEIWNIEAAGERASATVVEPVYYEEADYDEHEEPEANEEIEEIEEISHVGSRVTSRNNSRTAEDIFGAPASKSNSDTLQAAMQFKAAQAGVNLEEAYRTNSRPMDEVALDAPDESPKSNGLGQPVATISNSNLARINESKEENLASEGDVLFMEENCTVEDPEAANATPEAEATEEEGASLLQHKVQADTGAGLPEDVGSKPTLLEELEAKPEENATPSVPKSPVNGATLSPKLRPNRETPAPDITTAAPGKENHNNVAQGLVGEDKPSLDTDTQVRLVGALGIGGVKQGGGKGLMGKLKQNTLESKNIWDLLDSRLKEGTLRMNLCSMTDDNREPQTVKTMEQGGDFIDPRKHGLGFTCTKGLKPTIPNQDSWSVLKVPGDFSIYAVFDGHGLEGHNVSNFCKEHLLTLIVGDSRFKTDDMEEMFRDVFRRMQAVISNRDAAKVLSAKMSGTTATVAVHDHVKNTLTIAHVADSTAVIAKAKDGQSELEGVKLTRDHKPWLPEEKTRIESSGGMVGANRRVYVKDTRYPGLNMSRSFGDLLGHDVGVSCEAEVTTIQLGREERMLLICSDGVWEFISPTEAAELCAQYPPHKAMEAAEALAQEAWERWIKQTTLEGRPVVDDITVVLAHLRAVSL